MPKLLWNCLFGLRTWNTSVNVQVDDFFFCHGVEVWRGDQCQKKNLIVQEIVATYSIFYINSLHCLNVAFWSGCSWFISLYVTKIWEKRPPQLCYFKLISAVMYSGPFFSQPVYCEEFSKCIPATLQRALILSGLFLEHFFFFAGFKVDSAFWSAHMFFVVLFFIIGKSIYVSARQAVSQSVTQAFCQSGESEPLFPAELEHTTCTQCASWATRGLILPSQWRECSREGAASHEEGILGTMPRLSLPLGFRMISLIDLVLTK